VVRKRKKETFFKEEMKLKLFNKLKRGINYGKRMQEGGKCNFLRGEGAGNGFQTARYTPAWQAFRFTSDVFGGSDIFEETILPF
jgi:hypothetical protein